MRKLWAALAFGGILLVATPVTGAYGEALTSYEVSDANINISVPGSWAMATRDGVLAHPEILEQIGVTDDQLQQILLENNAYVDVIAPEGSVEILVTAIDPDENVPRVWNLHECSDALIKTMSDQMVAEIKSADYEATYENTYVNGFITYMVFSGSSTTDTNFYQEYYTVVNARMMCITIHSYTAELTADQKATLKQVVNNVRFLSVTEDPDPSLSPPEPGLSAYQIGEIIGRAIPVAVIAIVISAMIVRSRKKRAAWLAAQQLVPLQPPTRLPFQPSMQEPPQPFAAPQQPPRPPMQQPPPQ